MEESFRQNKIANQSPWYHLKLVIERKIFKSHVRVILFLIIHFYLSTFTKTVFFKRFLLRHYFAEMQAIKDMAFIIISFSLFFFSGAREQDLTLRGIHLEKFLALLTVSHLIYYVIQFQVLCFYLLILKYQTNYSSQQLLCELYVIWS